jgi:hypothetical protein
MWPTVCTSMPEAHQICPDVLPPVRSQSDWCRAPSVKRQATGRRPATNCRALIWRIDMRFKLQAASVKQQAASFKQGWFESFWGATFCRASLCHKDSRCKRQASSPKQQASSCKPRAASSLIFFPS